MANDAALAKAIDEMKGVTPYAVASKSGTDYDGSRFRIPFFNRVFLVDYPASFPALLFSEPDSSRWR
jgi:hypothetical protein